ncbi:MAG: hypothetical protein QGF59_29450, partial [Pirellulaceae bacterium]|nr:hypothetical protein [Pirellulaceae bacterium]
MTHQPQACRAAMNRRAFLVASGVGYAGLQFGGLGLAAPAAESGEAARTVTGPGRAKSTILFFLCGGASHLDTWDMKP